MATANRKSFEKGIFERGLQAQIILSNSKNQNNVVAIIVDGYKFDRLSLYTKIDVDILLDDITCNGTQKAYEHHTCKRSSVAKQKVNEAHGRTESETQNNQDMQGMTYADVLQNIQHLNKTWVEVLQQVVARDERSSLSLENWIEKIKHFHGDNFKKVIAKNANKTIFLINGHIHNRYALSENLKKCGLENFGREFSESEISSMIKMFVNNNMVVA